jgi:hypothetical protein
MAFVFGVVSFALGSALVAVCLLAIPGPDGAAGEHEAGGHDHGGH